MKKKEKTPQKRPKHVAETALTITVGFHFTSEVEPSKIVKNLCQKARGGKKSWQTTEEEAILLMMRHLKKGNNPTRL